MAKQGSRAEVNTFIQGLITEASPLNFPPNASQEEENFILSRDGTRRRRLGIDYKLGDTLRNTDQGFGISVKGITTFIWKTVGGDPGLEILVVQIAGNLHFYNISNPVGDGYLDELATPFDETALFSYASVEGRLVVVAGYETIGIISYASGVFTLEEKVLKVRDFWGVQTA